MKTDYERMQTVPISKYIKLLLLFVFFIIISDVMLSIEYSNNESIDFFEILNKLVTGIFQ